MKAAGWAPETLREAGQHGRPGQEWAGDERAACPGDMSSWLLEPRSRPTAWFLQV